jgi:endoglycosylceramidase
VAGTPISMSFDVHTGAFSLAYRPNPRISQPTVIFVPTTTHYPHDFCARSSGGVISKPAADIVDVRNHANSASVTVSIVSGHC